MLVAWGLFLSTGKADWDRARQIYHGSAYTLEEGEFVFGLLSPLQYGVTERLSVFVHPVFVVLLTPNFGMRIRLIDRRVALAFSSSYQQNFMNASGHTVGPATASGLLTCSVPIGWRIVVSSSFGYGPLLFPVSHRLLFSGGVNLLASHADLIMLQVHGMYTFGPNRLERPVINLMYAHAFGSISLAGGISVGRFAITYQVGQNLSAPFLTNVGGWPVYPFVDLWWRF